MSRLPEDMALTLARHWEPRQNPYSTAWESLVSHERPFMVELACYPDSRLSQEVERRFGKGGSIRLSEWNGANLETPEGISFAKRMIRRLRPRNLWISCECGPFSPLQRINQRTPQQTRDLEEKQRRARAQYKGAIEVAEVAFRCHTQVHWELSQRCEAWKLPEIEDFVQRHALEKVSCSGCAVGLRTKDGQKLLCKAWTIATNNPFLLSRMNLKCQNNHPRGKCEAGETKHTARYTEVFVRRVVESLQTQESWGCVVQEISQEPCQALVGEDDDHDEQGAEMTADEKKKIEAKIQHIHRSTGHGSLKNLVASLKRRGVPERVLRVAREWVCPVCTERKRPDPRRYANLETIAKRWEVVEADMATWVHPISKQKMHFVVFVDAGSRFVVAKILSKSKRNDASWEDLKRALEEHWIAMFGRPRKLRVDPAGPWRNRAADDYFSDKQIELEPIPAEAHWQLGLAENSIKILKSMLESLAGEFEDMEVRELLARSVWVCNNREVYKGFSPLQHMLGQNSDDQDRLFQHEDGIPVRPEMLADGGFRENFLVRQQAEKAFAEAQAQRRLERATNMGARRSQVYLPGDLVYYWRRQLAPQDRGSFQAGKFIGPARVLATETRQEDGKLKPGSVIWIHKSGRLLKASPEQLRKASPYEVMVEELQGPVELPWTITTIAADADRRTFEDITTEIPDEAEWETALDMPPEEEWVPARRVMEKGRVEMRRRVSAEGVRPQKLQRTAEVRGEKRAGAEDAALEPDPQRARTSHEIFYSEESHRRAYTIEIEVPESNRGWKRFERAPEAYVTSQVRKRGVEVRERFLTEEEAKQFAKAKSTEVKNFIAAECFKKAKEAFPGEDQVLGMRWLLTWKLGEQYEGGRKAKARAIILGYQDPEYEKRQTSAPTPSRAGRQLFFQYCAWKRFRLSKGDVSGAFLQGEKLEKELWCRPVPEICSEMGVAPETPMKLTKAAYGLVQAPLQWYQSVCKVLGQLGYRRLKTEPCLWIFQDTTGTVKSVIHGHVDDFVFGGAKDCPVHEALMAAVKQSFQWGTWEYDEFIQCGIAVKQREDMSIALSQPNFIDNLEEISISKDRARQAELPTTEQEKSWLRGTLGSLSWLCGQTCFLFAVDVNFLLSRVPVSVVDDITTTNKVVRDVKRWSKQEYVLHSFEPDTEPIMITWTDAAHANRPNGKDSTEGIFIGMSDPGLEHGREANVSPIYWRSGKIGRVCRSPACAETMACSDAEDDMLYLRVLWHELRGGVLDASRPNEAARQVRGLLVTDNRNLFDRIHRPTVVIKGSEKRSDIESIALREQIEGCETKLCWVHGGAMLANALTKPKEKQQALMYLQMGLRYKIVFDPQMMSEKQRRKSGLAPMDERPDQTEDRGSARTDGVVM